VDASIALPRVFLVTIHSSLVTACSPVSLSHDVYCVVSEAKIILLPVHGLPDYGE
jgi:hypothetical protein